MKFIADLHVHSPYSRATSPRMSPEGLWLWAQIKGIGLVATGDFTHPRWFEELSQKLEPVEEGLFALKKQFRQDDVPQTCASEVRFVLQAEISSIYKKAGRTRKVHSIVLIPGFPEAERVNERLSQLGNLRSDGRPILGLDAKELLRIVLDVSPEAMLIPAHAWTPHFSVFGAASGFDSLEECFDELTQHIHAIETGLSSDPSMNRRLSTLDGITLVSNSDCHSPEKLGREANLFDTGFSYGEVTAAIRTRGGFEGTIEFFPEEGKYHLDGHRACGVRLTPEETIARGFLCPVCGRKLTVGVMHRVAKLADRNEPEPEHYRSIIPLAEIIAEVMQKGVGTKSVQNSYREVITALGPEFTVLLDIPIEDIKKAGGDKLALAIEKMRSGDIVISPGFDGQFGTVEVFGKTQTTAKAIQQGRTDTKKTQPGLF